MTTKFESSFLYAQVDENDVIMVGFADDEFETNDYVLFQKSSVSNEQDKKLGFDKVHITYCNQVHSTYGDILKFVLKNGLAEITFDSRTASELSIDEQLEIVFPPNDAKLAEVKHYLAQMFIDKDGVFKSEA